MVMPSENAWGSTIVCLMDSNWTVRIVCPCGGFWVVLCLDWGLWFDDLDLHSNVSCEVWTVFHLDLQSLESNKMTYFSGTLLILTDVVYPIKEGASPNNITGLMVLIICFHNCLSCVIHLRHLTQEAYLFFCGVSSVGHFIVNLQSSS